MIHCMKKFIWFPYVLFELFTFASYSHFCKRFLYIIQNFMPFVKYKIDLTTLNSTILKMLLCLPI